MSLNNLFNLILKGGPGSGNKGHLGRPGKRGGSSPKNSGDYVAGDKAEGIPSILKNPGKKDDLVNFLETENKGNYKQSVFYMNPKSKDLIFSSGNDHVILSKTLDRNNAASVDDSMVHGVITRKNNNYSFRFRLSAAGIPKAERNYTEREKNKAYNRIYKTMDKLSNMGFTGSSYEIITNENEITGIL